MSRSQPSLISDIVTTIKNNSADCSDCCLVDEMCIQNGVQAKEIDEANSRARMAELKLENMKAYATNLKQELCELRKRVESLEEMNA